ncbi:formate--tetrahydrofolate ligase [Bacillus cereus]|nr:formate--tetrahydrofolate ligase [Bacillus cereus]
MGNLTKEKNDMNIIERKIETVLEKIYKGDKEAMKKLEKIKKAMVSK